MMELLCVDNEHVTLNLGGGGKPRIEYVDLMKGICIVGIVALHCDVLTVNIFGNLITAFLVPLYFLLSGVFFREYNGFSDFVIRKFDKLIVPSIFFPILYLIISVLIGRENCTIKDCILIMISGNRPIWFLRTLFLCNILFYALHKYIRNRRMLFVTCLVVGLAGCYVSQIDFAASQSPQVRHFIRIMRLFQPMTALPFFALGYIIKPYLTRDFSKKTITAVGCAALSLLYITGHSSFTSMYDNFYGSNPIYFYVAGISGIVCVALLCREIGKIPFVTYLGRYSIIVLGLHYIVLSILFVFIESKVMVLIITILSMFALIPVFIKLFPHFTAQKDLFRLKMPNNGN